MMSRGCLQRRRLRRQRSQHAETRARQTYGASDRLGIQRMVAGDHGAVGVRGEVECGVGAATRAWSGAGLSYALEGYCASAAIDGLGAAFGIHRVRPEEGTCGTFA